MGASRPSEETQEQFEEREECVFQSTVGRKVEGCLDPRDMRSPEWVISPEEQREATRIAQEWLASLRVEFPGKWVGDTENTVQRQIENDNAVRKFRGMSNE